MSTPAREFGVPQQIKDVVGGMSQDELEEFNRTFKPRIVEPYFRQIPHPAQQIALSMYHKELFWGGSAGGGKSSYLLLAALQFVDVPGYSALILRRTWPDLITPGAILDRMKDWMGGLDVKQRDQGRSWEFPSGATIQFGYVQREEQKSKFAGAEYQFIGYDEATHFEPAVYTFLFSRLRKPQLVCMSCSQAVNRLKSAQGKVFYKHANQDNPCPMALPDPMVMANYSPAPDGTTIFDVPPRVRAVSNPGEKAHEFFKNRFVKPEKPNPQRIFIPASLNDNPSLNREEYVKSLAHLSPVDQERLLNGDWEIMDSGNMFARDKFQFLDKPLDPSEIKDQVRWWDLAASTGKDSDYTVGAKVAITHDNRWVVLDIVRDKLLPHKVENLIKKTAEADGRAVKIRMEQEPGSAGKNNISHYARNVLPGYAFKGIRSSGDKQVRAGAYSAQVGVENVYLNPGAWNTAFLDEHVAFPTGPHDDQVDAAGSGFMDMTTKKKVRILA